MITSYVVGRWHRFAKTGFKYGLAEGAPAQLAMLLA
jgi:TetR/AcrR family transcriptional regulator